MIADFLAAYLVAWLTLAAFALGALPLAMLHTLTGGPWGDAVREPLTRLMRCVPWVALGFVPILFGLGSLYRWTAGTTEQGWWLNVPFFIVRSIVYFAVWIALSIVLPRRGLVRTPGAKRLCAFGLIAHLVVGTLASVDWIMSLDPEWHSTTFGLLVVTGHMLAALGAAVALAMRDADGAPESAQTRIDLGNLLLTMVMMWAYLSYTQYLVIWIGNLTSDIGWYVPRTETGWQWLGIGLIVLRFAVPFALLLSRRNKRDPRRLGRIALLLAALQLFESAWLVLPTLRPERFALRIPDVLAVVAVIAVGWWFAGRPAARPVDGRGAHA